MALSDFQRVRRIGGGGQGEVFEVIHLPTGRHFALKIAFDAPSSPQHPPFRPAGWSPHSRILEVHSHGITPEGQQWQVTDLLAPVSGRRAVEQGGPAAALSIFSQAAAGLAHLHTQGWIAADLKPDNLLIQATTNVDPWLAWSVWLSDLDLARPIGSADHVISGSRGYLAPELLSGAAAQSERTDIFALGAWLLWLVSGREAFADELSGDRLTDLIREELSMSLSRHDSRFDGAIWPHLLARILEPNPATRLSDGPELTQFLADHASNDPSWSAVLPSLIWNRRSTSPADARLLADASRQLIESADLEVLVVRPERGDFAPELVNQLVSQLGWETPLVIRADFRSEHLLDGTSSNSRRCVVVDVSRVRTTEAYAAARAAIELAILAEQGRAGGRMPMLILAQPLQDLSPLSLHDYSGTTIEVGSQHLNPAEVAGWLRDQFSSVSPAQVVLAALERHRVMTPGRIDRIFSLAEEKGHLRVSSGAVSIAEEELELLGVEARNPIGTNELSPASQAIRLLGGAIPGGIALEWLGPRTPTISRSELSGMESLGLVTTRPTTSGQTWIETEDTEISTPDQHCLSLVRVMLDAITAQSISGLDASASAAVAANFLAATAGSPGLTRGRALARSLISRGEYAVGIRLLMLHRALHPGPINSVSKVLSLLLEGRALICLGQHESGRMTLGMGYTGAQALGIPWLIVRSRLALATAEFDHGNRGAATALATELESAIVQGSDDLPEQLIAATSLFLIRLHITDLANTSIDGHFRRIYENTMLAPRFRVVAIAKWGRREFARGNAVNARRCFAEALRKSRHSTHAETIAAVLTPVMAYHFTRGLLARTKRLMDRASRLRQAEVALPDRTAWMSGLGALAYEQGQIRKSYDVNLHLYDLSKRMRHELLKSNATRNLGLTLRLMNHPAASRYYLQESARLGQSVGSPDWKMALINLCDLELELGRSDAVADSMKMLRTEDQSRSIDVVGASVLRLQGKELISRGEKEAGLTKLAEASRAFTQLRAEDEFVITELESLSTMLDMTPNLVDVSTAYERLRTTAARLGSWRISTMVSLARIRAGVDPDVATLDARLRTVVGEALNRGFVTLEIAALELLAGHLIERGWSDDARGILRSAAGRVRSAASEFADVELRRQYLAAPARQRLRELALSLT